MDQNNMPIGPVNMPIGPKVEPIADGPPPGSVVIPRTVLNLASVATDAPYRYRYAVDCLRVEVGPTGAHRAVATDGKILALVDWQYTSSEIPAGGGAALIPAAAVEAARKASAPRRGEREGCEYAILKQPQAGSPSEESVGPVLIARGAAGEAVLRASARPTTDFPPYADAVPGPDDDVRRTVVAVDVELLHTLATALCRATGGPKAEPRVYLSVPVDAAHKPILVSPLVDPARCEPPLTRALGILMPLASVEDPGRTF